MCSRNISGRKSARVCQRKNQQSFWHLTDPFLRTNFAPWRNLTPTDTGGGGGGGGFPRYLAASSHHETHPPFDK